MSFTAFTHDLSVSSGSNSKVLAFFSKLSSGAGEQLSLGGDGRVKLRSGM